MSWNLARKRVLFAGCLLGWALIGALAAQVARAQAGAAGERYADFQEDNEDPAALMMGSAQEPLLELVPQAAQEASTGHASVHGVVVNAATGSPLPRALVKLANGEELGALTDGDGRFEIPGVPTGMQTLQVEKPGFRGRMTVADYAVPDLHTVQIAAEMPDLHFSLSPLNAISGQIVLGNGEPGVGIGINLLRQGVSAGHTIWLMTGQHQSTPEGTFRFSGLADGTYLLMTEPAFDNERARAPECNAAAPHEAHGYPVTFFGGSADLAGAARIVIAGGQTTQANLTLAPAAFHEVEIAPSARPEDQNWGYSFMLYDRSGLHFEYPMQQDAKTRVLCGYLPDGAYVATMEMVTDGDDLRTGMSLSREQVLSHTRAGLVEFSVEGRAEPGLRMPLANTPGTPVRVTYEPAPPAPLPRGNGEQSSEGPEPEPDLLQISARRTDSAGGPGEESLNGIRADEDNYVLGFGAPGTYWVEGGVVGRPDVCIGAATAAGQGLGRTPLTVGSTGIGQEIDVVLRTDCAKLTLTMPPGSSQEPENFYFYLVPEFDSIADAPEGQLSAGGSAEVGALTPGTYRVYLFDHPMSLEYRNPAAMDKLGAQGQEVTLEPKGSASLVLEEPQP